MTAAERSALPDVAISELLSPEDLRELAEDVIRGGFDELDPAETVVRGLGRDRGERGARWTDYRAKALAVFRILESDREFYAGAGLEAWLVPMRLPDSFLENTRAEYARRADPIRERLRAELTRLGVLDAADRATDRTK